jgi:large conductance mechanosensitive channel
MGKGKKKSIKEKYREFVKEFKEFALEGFALSAAIGIMLGAALRDVINSLVNDIISPPISYLTAGIDFSTKYWVLGSNDFETIELAEEAGAVIIRYGNFINELITFFITAIILFLLVYQITRLASKFKKKKEVEEKKEKKRLCEYCKSEIHKDATRCPSCTSKL